MIKDLHDETAHSCEIMGPTGAIVQLAMAFCAFMILICKRFIEEPRRDWMVWMLDTSKQIISAGLAHVLNVLLALLMTTEQSGDSCSWYLITFLLDTTLGLVVNVSLLLWVEKILTKYNRENFKSGNYFQEKRVLREIKKDEKNEDILIEDVYVDIDYMAWTIQLIIWCSISIMCKSFMLSIQMIIPHVLNDISQFLLSWYIFKNSSIIIRTGDDEVLRLVIVMAMIPTIMNSLQFWIQDNFLKKQAFKSDKDLITKTLYFDEKANKSPEERYSERIVRPMGSDRDLSKAKSVVIKNSFEQILSPEPKSRVNLSLLLNRKLTIQTPKKIVDEKSREGKRIKSI